jgi:hypothetical protein
MDSSFMFHNHLFIVFELLDRSLYDQILLDDFEGIFIYSGYSLS